METQLQNLDNYDFSAAPQIIGQKPKYRASTINESGVEDGEVYEDITEIPPDDPDSIQPDFYIDRPPTAQYRPKERGVDVSTQIETYEPELFDFILEVEPVLQVIVGKTLEQARMELIEEEEKEALKRHKAIFEKKRNAELMVTQRMEAAYVRRKEERERRQLQHTLNSQQQKLIQMKLISRQMAKLTLRGSKHRILNDLKNLGYLRDDKLMVLRQHTLPWLIQNIANKTQQKSSFDKLFDQFIKEVEHQASQEHHSHYKVEMDKRSAILAERERIRIEIEERKKRKAEIKRRWAIQSKREAIKQQIENQVLSHAQGSENIFNVHVVESVTDPADQKPYTVLLTDLLLLILIGFDFILDNDADLTQIDDQTVLSFWIELLVHLPGTLQVVLNQQLHDLISNNLNLMEADPYLFNKKNKDALIEQLLNDLKSIFWANYSTNLYLNESLPSLRMELLFKLMHGFFDIYFKSINYRIPEPIPEDQAPDQAPTDSQVLNQNDQQPPADQPPVEPQEQQAQQENHEDINLDVEPPYQVPEVTQLDLEMVEAKKKIQFVYREADHQLPHVELYARLYIPWAVHEASIPQDRTNQSIAVDDHQHLLQQAEQVEQPVQQENEQKEEEKPKSKWDFDPKTIDIYDGTTPFVREGQQISLEDEVGQTYNFGNRRVLIYDQRSNYFARKAIYELLKHRLESFFQIVQFEQFLERFVELDTKVLDIFLHEVQTKQTDSPIFNYQL